MRLICDGRPYPTFPGGDPRRLMCPAAAYQATQPKSVFQIFLSTGGYKDEIRTKASDTEHSLQHMIGLRPGGFTVNVNTAGSSCLELVTQMFFFSRRLQREGRRFSPIWLSSWRFRQLHNWLLFVRVAGPCFPAPWLHFDFVCLPFRCAAERWMCTVFFVFRYRIQPVIKKSTAVKKKK